MGEALHLPSTLPTRALSHQPTYWNLNISLVMPEHTEQRCVGSERLIPQSTNSSLALQDIQGPLACSGPLSWVYQLPPTNMEEWLGIRIKVQLRHVGLSPPSKVGQTPVIRAESFVPQMVCDV